MLNNVDVDVDVESDFLLCRAEKPEARGKRTKRRTILVEYMESINKLLLLKH